MKKSLLMIGLGCVLAWLSPRAVAAATGSVQLRGHVPAIVRQLSATGHLAATNMNLALGLPVRNGELLTNLLQQISDPTSANYHKYLTPQQFADQFGPTAADYEAVADFARANGLTVTRTHANRLLMDVSGLSTDIERAFQVKFKTYHLAAEKRDFFATDVEPTIPGGLAIADISGLGNYSRPINHVIVTPLKVRANGLTNIVTYGGTNSSTNVVSYGGTSPGGFYMGNDFRNAYIPGSSLTGSGQTVALVQFDGYLASDIQEYESIAGRTNIPLQNIYIDGSTGAAGPAQIEVCLDLEMSVSMAPGLAKILVYEGNPNNFIPNDVLNQIATDNAAHQIGCSWGWRGQPDATTERIFQEMDLQGQSFFQASGDSDAYPAGESVVPPSDSPYVTSVGGTTLTMTANGGSRVSETTWNYDPIGGDGEGSSGGISTTYAIPYWQTNINMTPPQGSSTLRNFPDVALTGDGVFEVVFGGEETSAAGTSCAAPLWAAFASLINEQATNLNLPPVGFINPAIYAMAKLPNYTNIFNDLTFGSNVWSGSPNLFYCVTNYDLCAGLGTPNGTNLINALLSTNNIPAPPFQLSAPPQPYGTTMSAMNGGTPNGEWTLFVADEGHFNTGMISNGWSVTVTLGTPLGAVADLDVTMTNYVASVAPGSNVVFYISVTNYGVSTASNVFVVDTLPSGANFVSGVASTGSVIPGGTEVTWAVSNLLSGAGASLALTLQAPDVVGSILNSAVGQSDTPILNTADNSASASVYVGTLATPTLTGSSGTKGQFTLTVNGSTVGNTYIEASTNLAHGWTIIYTNVAPFTFTDLNETKYTNRFFRAITGP